MTDLKPRIFIGSSNEGIGIANIVCKQLEDFADCTIWTDAFKFGNSTFDELLNMLSLFDYGLLIATADDLTKFRKNKVITPRDNIIFEFGLFTGRLGKTRTFLLTEEGAKIPTDLLGVTLPFFQRKKGKALQNELKKSCESIKDHILNQGGIFDFGFLPSTALAFGYFKNFISKAITNLSHSKQIKLDDNTIITFKDIDFTILIPSDLSADMFQKINAARLTKNWKIITVEAGGYRPFDFSMDMTKTRKGKIHLCDIPITLNSLNEAISLYSQKTHIGKSTVQKLLEQREIRTFQNVLEYLILHDPYTKGIVKTEIVNI